MSKTTETKTKILNFLFEKRIFAWSEQTVGVPDFKKNFLRAASKKGKPDIIAILPPAGRFLGIEVKTGTDRERPEQEGFRENARLMGADVLTVKDFEDFSSQFELILKK